MNNCSKCIHYDVCKTWVDHSNSIVDIISSDVTHISLDDNITCGAFKDKSLYVELPCKVGDKVYKITRNKVKECEVVFIGISADEKCSYFNFVENYADGTFYKSYSMVFDVIGKTVFFTKAEAETKLKELNNSV